MIEKFPNTPDVEQVKECSLAAFLVTCVFRFICASNQLPKFLALLNEVTRILPTRRVLKVTFLSCCLVPMIMNSVLSSFSLSLSASMHRLMSSYDNEHNKPDRVFQKSAGKLITMTMMFHIPKCHKISNTRGCKTCKRLNDPN